MDINGKMFQLGEISSRDILYRLVTIVNNNTLHTLKLLDFKVIWDVLTT